jgi:hypothetical protein
MIVLAAVQGTSMLNIMGSAFSSASLFVELPVCFTQGFAFLSTARTTWVSLAGAPGAGKKLH